MQTFVDPSLTAYEAETQKMMSAKEERPDVPESATQILDMIETFKDSEHHERFVEATTIPSKMLPLLLIPSIVLLTRIFSSGRWVEAMESLPSLVVPGLVHLIAKGQTGKYTCQE